MRLTIPSPGSLTAGLTRHHWRLLGMLGAASFFEGYDINIVIVALPQIRETFSLSQAQASLWISVLFLGALPALLLSRRADRIGRKRLLILTVWGYSIATAFTAAATSIVLFAALQFSARVFLAAEVAVAWTMLAEELPAHKRGLGFGALAMLSALGTGLAAIIWGLAFAPLEISWRWLYVAGLPVLGLVIWLRRELPESRRFEAARDQRRLTSRWTQIFTPPYRGWLLLACTALFLAELTTQAQIFVVDFMQTQRGLSPSAANLVLITAGALAIPVLIYAGALSDRYGRKKVAIFFLVVSVTGPLLLFLVARSAIALFASLALTYAGSFGAWPTLGAYGSELFPTRLRALGSAAVGFAKVGGQFASFVAAAALIGALGSLSLAVAALALGPLLAVFAVVALPETKGKELEVLSGDDLIVPFSGELPSGSRALHDR